MVKITPCDALIVVDVQNDFLPGGALPVPKGDEVIEPLNRYIELFVSKGQPVFATRDWHPENHISFKENGALINMVKEATCILKKHLNPDGFNIGCNIGAVAGAGIADHLHFHIVPRWEGDHNYIAVIGDIRTIPEHFDATFDKLLVDFLQVPEQCY